MKKNSIELTKEQRAELEEVVKKGQAPARKRQHAQVMLKIDSGEAGPNWSDQQVKEAFDISLATIWRIRQRFLEHGLTFALNRRPQPERPEKRKLHGDVEAHLIAITCGPAPEGEGRWSLRMLANKLVQVGQVEEVSYETVRRTLKKTSSSRG